MRLIVLFLVLFSISHEAKSQGDCPLQDLTLPESWYESYPAFRIIGNLYSVGNAGLGVFLVATDDGHILINTGLSGSEKLIRANVESLGYELEDVKILLTMQAHFDHTADLAKIKKLTGAEMWATAADAVLLQDGGVSDPLLGVCEQLHFDPVPVDRLLKEGDVIELGETRLEVHEHRGHTPGSSSYSMTIRENGRDYNVLIANLGTINAGTRLVTDPTYPGIANDLAETYRKQKSAKVDVWVAAHGSQYGLGDKHEPGQPYNPDAFVDPDGFLEAVQQTEKAYLKLLRQETGQE